MFRDTIESFQTLCKERFLLSRSHKPFTNISFPFKFLKTCSSNSLLKLPSGRAGESLPSGRRPLDPHHTHTHTHTHTCPVLSQLSSTNRGYCLLLPACYLVGRISADTSSFLPSSAIPSSSTYSQTRLRPEKCRGRGYYPSKQTEDRCS